MAKKWIAQAISKPGALRAALHVKAGKDIPLNALKAAANKGGVMAKRANLAMNLRKMNKA